MIELRDNFYAMQVVDARYAIIVGNTITWRTPVAASRGFIVLPPGTWEIVCTSKEASPLQASEIVEHCWVENTNGHEQMNCLGGNGVWFNDPLIALRSLLSSKGCDLKNNYLILKKQ